jgi:hypothetical protein
MRRPVLCRLAGGEPGEDDEVGPGLVGRGLGGVDDAGENIHREGTEAMRG